jgi:hypothetical protein
MLTRLFRFLLSQHLDLALVSPGPYPPDISQASVQIYYVTEDIVRIKIYDASAQRFEGN